jgi:hypothetical protein
MLETIKNAMHNNINELFATAAVDEMAGDTDMYREKINKIALIAELLGIETKLTEITFDLKIS